MRNVNRLVKWCTFRIVGTSTLGMHNLRCWGSSSPHSVRCSSPPTFHPFLCLEGKRHKNTTISLGSGLWLALLRPVLILTTRGQLFSGVLLYRASPDPAMSIMALFASDGILRNFHKWGCAIRVLPAMEPASQVKIGPLGPWNYKTYLSKPCCYFRGR